MSSSNPWSMFGTDPNLETHGIRVDYGAFYFMVARAGGANDRFSDNIREKMRPYARALDLGEMDEKVAQKLTGEAFAESVVLGWGKVVDGDDVPGKMPQPEGEDLDFTVDNCKRVFRELPELLTDLMQQAGKRANFRKVAAEEDGKNSKRSSGTH